MQLTSTLKKLPFGNCNLNKHVNLGIQNCWSRSHLFMFLWYIFCAAFAFLPAWWTKNNLEVQLDFFPQNMKESMGYIHPPSVLKNGIVNWWKWITQDKAGNLQVQKLIDDITAWKTFIYHNILCNKFYKNSFMVTISQNVAMVIPYLYWISINIGY